MAQMVKNLPTVWETWVLSLGWDDPREEEMATHSSIFAWRVPMGAWGGAWGATVYGVRELDTTEHTANAPMSSGRRGASLGNLLHMM